MNSHIPAAMFFTAMFIMLCSVPFIYSCETHNSQQVETIQEFPDGAKIIVIDSCEYAAYSEYHETSIAHHGDCKFCKARKL